MRALKFALVGVVLLSIQILILLLRQKVHIAAASIGTACGLLLGIIVLIRFRDLSKKGIFVDKASQRDRQIVVFIICPLVLVFGVVATFVQKRCFPEVDISKVSITALTFFIFVSCVIEAVGVFILERQYGRKFYIGKRKE